jgi:NADH-quinone oxidoreductase subunit L
MMSAAQLWWIPALPLTAAAISAVLPRTAHRLSAALSLTALGAATVLAVLALGTALANPGAREVWNFRWFDLGPSTIELGLVLDPMSAFMLAMVTVVGLLIFIFSRGYMAQDPNAGRFFCFLSFFAAAMLGLVVANSLLLLFVCWELVGLASYLLIGFWHQRPAAAAAAQKAFLVTRIGDLGLLLGLLWLHETTGTLLFYDGGRGLLETDALAHLALLAVGGGVLVPTAIGLLIFWGACGKSGQFPLHGWLPDAMEGPTPVSALIHAATMVAAGVFLLARVFPLLELDRTAPGAMWHALDAVAWIGGFTALLGAALAVAQWDLKRVLAYSTISQLGYMTLAVGVGAPQVAMFHLLTHACFKALLFLAAGSVIHAAHHEQDVRQLGGLGQRMRLTAVTFAIGSMALAGVPFLFSGFWSKEAILHAAHAAPGSSWPFLFALAAVALTAFYSTRLVALTFLGAPRSGAAEHARESPTTMTVPLAVLAVLSVGLGFLGTPAWPWLTATLAGERALFAPGELAHGAGLMALSVALVGTGFGLGWVLYLRRPRQSAAEPDPLERGAPALFAALAARLHLDAFFRATVVRAGEALAGLAAWLDRWVWGGAVRGTAALTEAVALTTRQGDEDAIDGGFDAGCEGLRESAALYRRSQSGEVQGYLRAVAAAFVVLALILLLGGGGR